MTLARSIQHCKKCGARVTYLMPPHANLERAVCSACHWVHYENPLNVVGTVPVWQNQVLLCRRNIEPRRGFWTLPGGFMELGETVAQGAERETIEEAGAQIELQGLYAVLNVVHVGQVHFFFRARLISTVFHPGIESSEVALFSEENLPFGELAFKTVETTLRHYFNDQRQGHYNLLYADIT
jgi:ADP-ribose pyrophosphatase YjhB (NUDIX family)